MVFETSLFLATVFLRKIRDQVKRLDRKETERDKE